MSHETPPPPCATALDYVFVTIVLVWIAFVMGPEWVQMTKRSARRWSELLAPRREERHDAD